MRKCFVNCNTLHKMYGVITECHKQCVNQCHRGLKERRRPHAVWESGGCGLNHLLRRYLLQDIFCTVKHNHDPCLDHKASYFWDWIEMFVLTIEHSTNEVMLLEPLLGMEILSSLLSTLKMLIAIQQVKHQAKALQVEGRRLEKFPRSFSLDPESL